MICQNCSNVIPDGSTFCGYCGQAVVASPVPSESAPVVPDSPAAVTVVPEPAPAVAVPEPPAAPAEAQPVVATPEPEAAPAPDTTTFFRDEKQERRLGAWGYVWTDIVLQLPIIGIVMFFVWCFSSGTNKARQSYVRSRFIWFVISLVLTVVFFVVLSLTDPNFMDSFNKSVQESLQSYSLK